MHFLLHYIISLSFSLFPIGNTLMFSVKSDVLCCVYSRQLVQSLHFTIPQRMLVNYLCYRLKLCMRILMYFAGEKHSVPFISCSPFLFAWILFWIFIFCYLCGYLIALCIFILTVLSSIFLFIFIFGRMCFSCIGSAIEYNCDPLFYTV